MSPEGDVAVIADEDHSALRIVSLPLTTESKPVDVETPGRPAQVAFVGRTLLVTLRAVEGRGVVVVYERGAAATELKETARVEVPADAWGVAVSPDGALAAVTSAWTAKVSIVDLATRTVIATRDVAREPRGALFSADGRSVYVSHLVGGALTKLTDVRGAATVSRVDLPAAPVRAPSAEKLEASLGYGLVASPDRRVLFAPRHALGALGSGAWYGTAAVDSIDTATDTPRGTTRQVNAHSSFVSAEGTGLEVPKYTSAAATAIAAGDASFAVPRGAVYRKSQRSILVVSEGTNVLAELDATMSDPTLGGMHTYDLVTDREPILRTPIHGGAPSGVALSPDERTAFVYCRSTDELAAVPLAEWEGPVDAVPPTFVKLAPDATEADYVAGRRIFYDAENEVISGGMSCSGCHPDGRDDGHVWHEVVFLDGDGKPEFENLYATASAARHIQSFWTGIMIRKESKANIDATGAGYARRTPMLVDRVRAIGPYGWHADGKDLDARLARGFGLHRWGSGREPGNAVVRASAYRVGAFLRKGLVAPPREDRELTAEEARGKEIFMSPLAACGTCHAPASQYTTRDVVPIAEPFARPGFLLDPDDKFKVPSLVGLAGHAPYFHDGRFATLEALVAQNGDRMGKTSHLSEGDRKALVAFLKTL